MKEWWKQEATHTGTWSGKQARARGPAEQRPWGETVPQGASEPCLRVGGQYLKCQIFFSYLLNAFTMQIYSVHASIWVIYHRERSRLAIILSLQCAPACACMWVCVKEVLHHGLLLCISSQLYIWWAPAGSLKSTVVTVFTPQEWADSRLPASHLLWSCPNTAFSTLLLLPISTYHSGSLFPTVQFRGQP